MNILVVSIDPAKDLLPQLKAVSESSKMSLVDLLDAWNTRQGPHITTTGPALPIQFNIEKLNFDESEKFVEQHSYKAVKDRNKFFNRKRRK